MTSSLQLYATETNRVEVGDVVYEINSDQWMLVMSVVKSIDLVILHTFVNPINSKERQDGSSSRTNPFRYIFRWHDLLLGEVPGGPSGICHFKHVVRVEASLWHHYSLGEFMDIGNAQLISRTAFIETMDRLLDQLFTCGIIHVTQGNTSPLVIPLFNFEMCSFTILYIPCCIKFLSSFCDVIPISTPTTVMTFSLVPLPSTTATFHTLSQAHHQGLATASFKCRFMNSIFTESLALIQLIESLKLIPVIPSLPIMSKDVYLEYRMRHLPVELPKPRYQWTIPVDALHLNLRSQFYKFPIEQEVHKHTQWYQACESMIDIQSLGLQHIEMLYPAQIRALAHLWVLDQTYQGAYHRVHQLIGASQGSVISINRVTGNVSNVSPMIIRDIRVMLNASASKTGRRLVTLALVHMRDSEQDIRQWTNRQHSTSTTNETGDPNLVNAHDIPWSTTTLLVVSPELILKWKLLIERHKASTFRFCILTSDMIHTSESEVSKYHLVLMSSKILTQRHRIETAGMPVPTLFQYRWRRIIVDVTSAIRVHTSEIHASLTLLHTISWYFLDPSLHITLNEMEKPVTLFKGKDFQYVLDITKLTGFTFPLSKEMNVPEYSLVLPLFWFGVRIRQNDLPQDVFLSRRFVWHIHVSPFDVALPESKILFQEASKFIGYARRHYNKDSKQEKLWVVEYTLRIIRQLSLGTLSASMIAVYAKRFQQLMERPEELISRFYTYTSVPSSKHMKEQATQTSFSSPDECLICMNPYTDAIQCACRHAFCFTCIHFWITTCHSSSKPCPTCRSPLYAHEFRLPLWIHTEEVKEQVLVHIQQESIDIKKNNSSATECSIMADNDIDCAPFLKHKVPLIVNRSQVILDWLHHKLESSCTRPILVIGPPQKSFKELYDFVKSKFKYPSSCELKYVQTMKEMQSWVTSFNQDSLNSSDSLNLSSPLTSLNSINHILFLSNKVASSIPSLDVFQDILIPYAYWTREEWVHLQSLLTSLKPPNSLPSKSVSTNSLDNNSLETHVTCFVLDHTFELCMSLFHCLSMEMTEKNYSKGDVWIEQLSEQHRLEWHKRDHTNESMVDTPLVHFHMDSLETEDTLLYHLQKLPTRQTAYNFHKLSSSYHSTLYSHTDMNLHHLLQWIPD